LSSFHKIGIRQIVSNAFSQKEKQTTEATLTIARKK